MFSDYIMEDNTHQIYRCLLIPVILRPRHTVLETSKNLSKLQLRDFEISTMNCLTKQLHVTPIQFVSDVLTASCYVDHGS